ncbi:hypothetical protein [Candidatus Mycoplasma mahonii]|uniref:hypothetical protein n=1 Tax=Candidatus Mycoplasma mahonii TaxID=3004105 RepID=UPI0026F297CB|nr:hypothetical protein [Candidatus Mycoplasma mahonii]WKX02608.1 hypothetical protein O3I44_00820 [Candidatus Mycoplasma mahonii]
MSFIEKVKKENKIVYQILANSYSNNKIVHAYLFSAMKYQEIINEPNMLIDLLINEKPFSGKTRSINSYADLIVLDGSNALIKKGLVIDAANKLQESALDDRGIKILLIKNVENTNIQSINSLLKFIEEPTPNTFIIMTTNNISAVIPTIKSRSQIINVKKLDKNIIEKKLSESDIPSIYTTLLANIADSYEEAMKIFRSNVFQKQYNEIIIILQKSIVNKDNMINELMTLILKFDYKTILYMIKEFFNDIWKTETGLNTSFKNQEKLLHSYKSFNYKKAIPLINDFLISQNSYVNFELYKTSFLIHLEECYE